MKIKNIYMGIAVMLLSSTFTGCDDNIDPLIEELELSRVFSPIGLEAFIRNNTTIELDWTVNEDADHYVVEFSEDSLEFTTIIRTVMVNPDELPLRQTFFGDTRYSARVMAVSATDAGDSKWSAITIETASENIFEPLEQAQIGISDVTLNWPAGQQSSRFVINPGNIERAITAQEVADGEATITGLDYYTEYTITMYAGNSQRGRVMFKTLMDPDCPTCVKLNPGDDINAAIVAAADGSILVLSAGTYANQGAIDIGKSITIQGTLYYDRPIIDGQITCGSTVNSIHVISLIFQGDGASPSSQFFNTLTGCNLATLSIEDCEISGYSNNLIYNNNGGAFGTINISDSYMHDIPGGGGDGIDFRGGSIGSLTVNNSTFANGFRTFLRMQVECISSFTNCTFYRVANNDNGNNNGLFRSSGGGSFEVSSCLFVETGVPENPTSARGNFCRQASYMVASPVYANNNIFNCYNIFTGLYTSAAEVSATEIDPVFVDAASENFKVTTQTLIDNKVGDQQWQ